MCDGVTVDVVPATVQDVTGVEHGGKPLVRVVSGQNPKSRSIFVHAMQRVDVPALAELAAKAPRVTAPSRGTEGDAAVRQPARHQIVIRPGSQLAEV